MSSASEKVNLARIRDNQRRSRARRKEYLQELEARVRQCELQGIEATSEIQVAARRVADENRKLRLLLNQSGIFDDMIEHHLASTVLPESYGGGQAVALLEELLQPRKPCGPGGTPMSVSVGDNMRNGTRDGSSASMSTSHSSIWDKPTATAHSSSGQKQHRSFHCQTPLHKTLTSKAPPNSAAVSPELEQSGSADSIKQRPNISAFNVGQRRNLHIQSSLSSSPASTSVHPSPSYDPKTFDFDDPNPYDFDAQTNSYESNNFFFQTPSPNALQTNSSQLDSQLASQNSPAQPLENAQLDLRSDDQRVGESTHSPNFDYALMNTSSCLFAADMIRTMTGGREEDVRAELGCGGAGEDCDVSDEIVFGMIGRYP